MKFSNTQTTSQRVLVALTLTFLSLAGFAGKAEAATCLTCHAPVGSTTDIRPEEQAPFRNITTGSIKGSHAKHIPVPTLSASTCSPCHGTAVESYSNKHRDGFITVTSAGGIGYSKPTSFPQSGSKDLVLGSCSTASCHNDPYSSAKLVSPVWGNSVSNCTACHATNPITATGPATGGHVVAAHGVVCTTCHAAGTTATSLPTSATHNDGNITISGTVAVGYPATVAKHAAGSGYTSCSTASCHENPYGTVAVTTPVWGATADKCTACHTVAIDATGPATGSHVKHNDSTCTDCHAAGTTAGTKPDTGHLDGTITVTNGYPATTKHAANSGYTGTCNNASCHSNVYGTGTVITPVWGDTSKGCSACHAIAIAATGPATGSHAKHTTATCTDCHNAGTTQTAKPSTGHADGKITVNNGYPATITPHAAGTYDANAKCTSASCHDNGKGVPATTPVWGATGVPACTACHALVPGDSHTKHVTSTLYKKVACADCHTGYVQGTTAAGNHINGTVEVNTGGYPSPKAKGIAFASCDTSYCHSNGQSVDGLSATPVYATVAPTWGGSAACGSCHAVLDIATGTHATHLTTGGATCNSCHTGADSGLTYNSTLHVNGQINVNGGYGYPTDKTPGNGYGTCVAAGGACHANPYGATTPAVTWGVNTPGACTACHNGANVITANGPATGSHTTVNGHKVACTFCHTAGTTATSVPAVETAIHKNDNVDVVGVGYLPTVALHATGSGYSSCSAASCHNNPYGSGSVVTPVWGTISGCAACHKDGGAFTGTGSAPATGTHNAHMALSGTLCSKCHDGASANTNGGTSHNNGTVNVTNNYPATAKHTAGSYSGTCSNTANGCHGTMVTPVWGTVNTYDTCTKCHGTGTPTASLTADNRYVLAPADATALDTGAVSTNAKIGAHQTHLRFLNSFSNYSTVDYRCQGCHGPLPSSGSHANSLSTPAFQGMATLNNTFATSYNNGTCSVYCHNPAGSGGTMTDAGSNVSPSWNDPTYIIDGGKNQVNCGKCHKVPGDANFSKQAAHGPGMVTNAATDCTGCHSHNGDVAGPLGQRHLDGTFFANGACNSCHGYPPMTQAQYDARKVGEFVNAGVEKYTGGGGYHSSHLAATIVVGDEFKPCLPCHPSTSHKQGGSTVAEANINVFDAADTINRFDGARSKRYNAGASTCSNISCHFKPSPAWNL